jgi:acyl carrier protein
MRQGGALSQTSIPVLVEPGGLEQEALVREVQDLFLQKLNIRVASATQDLFQAGILDSSHTVQLLLHIEDHFGLRLPIEDVGADSLRSIDSIARLVTSCKTVPEAEPLEAEPLSVEQDTIRVIQQLFLDKMAIRVESVDADLFQTGVFDSMTLVEFILHLEEHFGLRFPMEDLELDSVLSITSLAAMVNNGKPDAKGGGF